MELKDTDNNILSTLQAIQEQTAKLNRVSFVFHPWYEFNNLGVDGFRISAVQHPTIPRLSLIPLVSLNVKHLDSRKDSTTNKYVSRPVPYERPIRASYIDLLQRYGRYGLVILPSLDCSLEDAIRLTEAFNLMMAPFRATGLLEDLPEYFGVQSPVAAQFDSRQTRLYTTASEQLDACLSAGTIEAADVEKLRLAIPVLADSAEKAHRAALTPSNGTLTQSIAEINDRRKTKFDEVDVFLQKEFPGFNSDSLLSRSNKAGSLDRVADLLERVLERAVTPQGVVPPEVAAVVQQAQGAIAQETTTAGGPSAVVIPADTSGVSDAELGVDLTQVQPNPADLILDPEACLGITSAGRQCKMKPDPSLAHPEYCPVHQSQGEDKAEAEDEDETQQEEAGQKSETVTA